MQGRVDYSERRDIMNYTEETQVADEASSRKEKPRRRLLVRVALATLFVLSSLPLGFCWFLVLVVLVLIGLPLTIVWVGLPILALAMLVCILGADTERWRLAVLLDTRLSSPYRPLRGGSMFARLRGWATDPALWRGLLYLLLLLPIGLVEFVVICVMAFSATLATYPLWFWTLPEGQGLLWSGVFVADTLPEAVLVMIVGLVAASAAVAFVLEVARAHAHLGRVLLGPSGRESLEERVEVLTESRSKTLEAAIVERRRIERDLHDGAQQRLVSLAMKLGMARQKLDRETSEDCAVTGEPVAKLVGEAHEEAKLALAEIRDLIRGIHPAVLTDRGLDAAISALAGRSPVPVSVDVHLDERPPEPVEITAYFIIAEALTNTARHSEASGVHVRVRREKSLDERDRPEADLLVVEVEDDGKGGADPAGAGLGGLADRMAALDGRLLIESPEGGPTRVHAELPWGSTGESA
jgi:signal transduction histidine kinase